MTAWPKDRTDQLKALHAEKKSHGQIGRIMGMSKGTISGKVFRLGLLPRNGQGFREKSVGVYPAVRKLKKPPTPVQEANVQTDEPEFLGPKCDFPPKGKCRFIAGDPATTEWRCCGHDAINGGPYCGRHDLICRPIAAKKVAA